MDHAEAHSLSQEICYNLLPVMRSSEQALGRLHRRSVGVDDEEARRVLHGREVRPLKNSASSGVS